LLSKVVLNEAIETNVIAAFDMLHKHGIYHGDVRTANVLVRDDNSVVLVDFERSVSNADKMMLLEEEDEVRHMLASIRPKKI
jgi:RIO-like serine/threonine protein kinase